uniref:Retrovirus-related Pol polyprotein from transposon TNT 1-94 n=1 Tax=Tanacetum cinerariifolium TaxID=118510 RepID=A0A6L2NWK4_TANCI|nr:retrovirus-related Pol polyprotein from transposon TNT 1-94 [Tanacetum cinerariifolium]
MENYKNVSQDIRDQLNVEAEAVQIILTGIDNDIYSTVDACPNACEMWKAIERLKQGESINVQDLETNLYWEFGKFTSRDGESLESYYSRFYKMMNELVRNKCDVTNHQVNVQSQQAATRNREKAIVNSPPPIYDREPSMVAEDDEMSKDKEIDKLMDLISLSFKKIYKPTNNNLRTSSNTSRENQDNSPRINRGAGYDNQRLGNVAGARKTVGTTVVQKSGIQCYNCKEFGHVARECQKPKRAKDAAYHREKMLLYAADSGPIFDSEPLQKVSNDDHYNVFAIESEHPERSKSVHDTYPIEQDEHNVIIDSLDMSYDREQLDQDDDDLTNERELLASLIKKLKCEIDDSKNRNKFLETSNTVLVEKLKGEIKDFRTQNKSLESSNNHFKEANNKLSETNALMYKDLKKFQAELDRRNDVKYASKIEIDCAKAKVDLISYKMESQKSFNAYTQKINDLNQTISKMKKELFAHQETISILSQAKEAQIKLYKTREDKKLDKVISLENKVKILPLNKKSILKNTNVLAPGMYKLHTEPTQTRTSQLPNDFRKTNKRVSFSTGVIPTTSVSRPQLKSNQKEDRVMLNNSQGKKQDVEDHHKNVKFSKNKTSVTACKDSLKDMTSNVNFVCATCGKCVLNEKHDMCVLKSLNGMNSRTKMPIVVPVSTREPKRTVNKSVAKPLRRTVASESNQKARNTTRKLYEHVRKTCSWWYPKFTPPGYNWHSTVSNTLLYSISFAARRDNPIHLRLWKSTCYIRDLKGNNLLTGSRETDLYSITLQDTTSPNPIYLMAKVTSSQAWLWHRRLSHLNFDTINLLLNNDIVVGLPKLKFVKDNLCSSCELGKAKRKSFQTKTTPSSKRRLQLLHMDGNDLLTGSRGTDLYSITLQDSNSLNPICLMAKATSSQAWLWHRRLSHLNFDTINLLSKNDIVVGLPKLKFVKYRLCSSCELGKAKRKSFHTKLTTGSRETDLYSITLQDTTSPNPIYLMAKVTSSQAWLWHRRLSHLNFDTINLLLNNDIVVGLPKLKFVKDNLCSSCELGKAKRKSFQTKTTPSSKRRLQLLHMDVCGPMRVASINGKKYVLIIVDDYSRYTWTYFLRSKDETLEVLIDFLRLVQRGLHAQVRIVRTDKGTEFLNKTLYAYFAYEGILYQTSIARTPEQNGIVERQNHTLVEAARTMLSAAKVPLFFWAEAIATTCFTQNRSLVIPRHEKTPYHIINDRKSSVKFFHIFGSLCYIIRDGENLDKMKEKYHVSSDPVPQYQSTALKHDILSPGLQCQEDVPHTAETVTTSNELDLLFSPMFAELLNGSSQVVSKSFVESTADTPNQQNAQVKDDEFINIFCTHVQDRGETSSRHVDSEHSYTIHMGLWYPKDTSFELTAFLASDHAGCLDSRKSTSGGIQFLGGDKLVSWSSKKQDCTSMSLTEAEYVSLSACCAQVL